MPARSRPLPIVLSGNAWVVHSDFTHRGWDGVVRVIPAGFKTDLASIPWIARVIFPRYDEVRARAAIPHDFYYATQPEDVDRMAADRMFFRDLVIHNAHVWQAVVMYLAVRWFGWIAWNRSKGRK